VYAACASGQFGLAREQARILSGDDPLLHSILEEDIAEAESIAYQVGEGVLSAYVNQACPF
jgi:hypothetical protein